MKTIKEQIEVMQHYANGGEVEHFRHNEWLNCPNPKWDWIENDYRIKEQKKTVTIERWLVSDGHSHRVIEAEKIADIFSYPIKQVKLLETYEVEI